MHVFEWVEHLLLKMDWNSNDSLFTTHLLFSFSALTTHHLSTPHGKVVLPVKKVWQVPLLSNVMGILGIDPMMVSQGCDILD